MEHLWNDHKDSLNQDNKLCNEMGLPDLSLTETTWSEFPNGRKAIAEQTLASGERKKSKGAGLCELQSGIRVGKLPIWVRSFEIEKL